MDGQQAIQIGDESSLVLGLPPSIGVRKELAPFLKADLDARKKAEGRLQQIDERYDTNRAVKAGQIEQAHQSRDEMMVQGVGQAPLPPTPEFHPREMDEGFSLMLGLAALAGVVTKAPLTAALNNMAAMAKGLNEGNQENYNRAWKEYESNAKKVIEVNKEAMGKFDKLMKRKDLSIDQLDREMRLLETEYGLQTQRTMREQNGISGAIMAAARLSTGLDKVEATITAKKEEAAAKSAAADESSEDYVTAANGMMRFSIATGEAQERQRDGSWKSTGGHYVVPSTDEFGNTTTDAAPLAGTDLIFSLHPMRPEEVDAATVFNTLGKLPPNMGRGIQGTKQATRIRQAATHLREKAGLTEDDIVANREEYRSNASSLNKITYFLDRSGVSMQQAKESMDIADELAGKALIDGVPLISKMVQWEKGQIQGDPDLAKFMTALAAVQKEYERTVMGAASNAHLPVAALQEAHKLMNESMTPQAFRASSQTMRLEMDRLMKAANEKRVEIVGRIKGIARGAAGKTDSAVKPYDDPEKERAYQEWKKSHGG